MPLYDFFRSLLNIPSRNEGINESNERNEPNSDRHDYSNNFWGPNGQQYEDTWRDAHDSRTHPGSSDDNMRNFNVFTDPLEMNRYFEHQMNEMFKSFGGFFGADSDTFFGFDQQPPTVQPEIPSNGNLRDRFLKPGYETKTGQRDQVLDDQVINAGDLDDLLKDKGVVSPYQQKPLLPQIRSFGQSMSSKTVRRPDGTIEIHKTVKDSAGNEETVVTRQMGDKQYTVTIRTDKEGRQEKCEDLINLDEKELPQFKDNWNQNTNNKNNRDDVDDLNRLFPYFDKYFK